MRPYLAVIRDSFHEALASRVLWVLLALITVVLGLMAPFGFREQLTTGIQEGDVREWQNLIGRLKKDAEADSQSPAAHIISQLDEKLQKQVTEFKLPGEGDLDEAMKFVRTIRDFREGLDKALHRPDFYNREAWKNTTLSSDELKLLLDQKADQLSELEQGRRNRLLLEAAYPDMIEASPPVSLQLRYLIWDVFEPLPLRQKEFRQAIEGVVSFLLKGFVGVVGVFVAIVVTAPIVPQMFETGQLHLLLSKPISRSLLFLSKFIGGCAFILVNAVYLITGCWAILGMRFGIWDVKLLLGIPIYLFMFAIYYTVSALTGVFWRNSIVSIGMTVVFWLVCFLVGLAKSGLESVYLSKQRFVQLVPADDQLIGVNEMGLANRWDETQRRWDEVFVTDMQRQLRPAMLFIPNIPSEMKPVGPVYDASGKQLLSVQRNFRNGSMTTYVGPKDDDWKSLKGVSASVGAMALLREPDGKILCVSSVGFFRLIGDPKQSPEPVKLFGFAIPLPTASAYESVGPEESLIITRPAALALHPDSGDLAVYSRGKLTLLKKDEDGRFERRWEKQLDPNDEGSITLGYGGDKLLVGREDGRLLLYDEKSGEELKTFQVEGRQAPRFITAAPGGGQFAVVFHHGKLWIYDAAKQEMIRPRVKGQGDVSVAVFTGPQQLLVADRRTRVTEYGVTDWAATRSWNPNLRLPERLYSYFLLPLYTIFPKPGELDDTIDYLLSGKSTVAASGGPRQELSASQTRLHPWDPVWSSGLFVIVALGLSCLYLERQEF